MTRLLLPILLLTACPPKAAVDDSGSPSTGGDGGATSEGQQMAVLTTASLDYATGSMATIDLDTWQVTDSITTTAGDASVRAQEGLVIQLNRFGYDSVRLYTPGLWDAPTVEIGVSDGEGTTNPHDAAVCADQLFISLYERSHLLVLDPTSGTVTGRVDLSAYDDADGPEPSSMVRRGHRLYVALERLDRGAGWIDAGGMVVEVDCTTATATRAWEIGGNTRVYHWADEDRVLVGARAYKGWAEGIYVLDPDADTVELAADVGVTGNTLGGVAASGGAAVMTTLSEDLSTTGIHCVDLGDGSITDADSRTEYLQSVSVNDRGQAWISAHWGWTDPDGARPGVIVYDIATCTSLTGDSPFGLDLAPTSVAFY